MSILEYVKREVDNSRLLEYSVEYSEDAKNAVDNSDYDGGMLNSDQHSAMSEMDFLKNYSSRTDVLKWYFGYLSNERKMEAIGQTAGVIKKHGFKRVLSLGCGPGVPEYFLKLMFGDQLFVMATDYDTFYVNKGNEVFGPDIIFRKYDFNDNAKEILDEAKPDLVIMYGSACSMKDDRYVSFLRELADYGCNDILTFEAGIYSKGYYKGLILTVLKAIKRYLFHVPNKKNVYGHAYGRSHYRLTKIYKDGGYIANEIRNGVYEYSYHLTLSDLR